MAAHHQDSITAQTPLWKNMVVPPVFKGLTRQLDTLTDEPLLAASTEFPKATFALGLKDASGNSRAQAIAHRGYKAKFPENTMGAFKGAVEVGAEAIETDIHLSKDGVVVLSHDANLKRCFNRPEKIIDCDWEFLSQLETTREPRQKMPRLVDLLEYLTQPGREHIWVLLDIKLDIDPEDVIRLIASTIASIPDAPGRPWTTRIVLGIWATKYLPLCSHYLPNFPVTHIGFSLHYASRFFKVPNVSFNLLNSVLMTPWGKGFVRKAHAQQRPVFAWTVNDKKRMLWDLKHGIDGVITDDPKLFLDVRKGFYDGMKVQVGLFVWLDVLRISLFEFAFSILLYWKFGFDDGPKLVRSGVEDVED